MTRSEPKKDTVRGYKYSESDLKKKKKSEMRKLLQKDAEFV